MESKPTGKIPKKRVDLVRIRMVREGSVLYENRKIRNPDDAVSIARDFLQDEDRERVIAIYLNSKNEPTAIHTVSIGNINTSIVHPREVMKAAILSNAAAMILAHNHPSGDCTPSKEDKEITKRLKEAGEILGIEVLDHLIVGNNNYVSIKESEGI